MKNDLKHNAGKNLLAQSSELTGTSFSNFVLQKYKCLDQASLFADFISPANVFPGFLSLVNYAEGKKSFSKG